MNLIDMVKSSKNPQALLLQLVQARAGNNPLMQNLLQMIQTNNQSGIEQLAKNIATESGYNPDQLLQQILNK